jgi:hypothetical protein
MKLALYCMCGLLRNNIVKMISNTGAYIYFTIDVVCDIKKRSIWHICRYLIIKEFNIYPK